MVFEDSALIGLGVIIIAWIIQLAYSWKGNREIRKSFLILYGIGTALLIIDSYLIDKSDVAVFNLIILLLTMCILIMIGARGERTARVVKKKKR